MGEKEWHALIKQSFEETERLRIEMYTLARTREKYRARLRKLKTKQEKTLNDLADENEWQMTVKQSFEKTGKLRCEMYTLARTREKLRARIRHLKMKDVKHNPVSKRKYNKRYYEKILKPKKAKE